MKRTRRLSMEILERRIVLDGVGLTDPPGTSQWESIIVTLKKNVGDPANVARSLVSAQGGQLGHVYEHALKGFSAQLPKAAVEALQKNPQIERIELDLQMQAFGQVVPTGVDRIEADLKLSGDVVTTNVDVAVIDTGIDGDHPDLDVIGGTHFYTITTGPPKSRGSHEDGNYEDDNGHGSHVAGIIAAEDNNVGVVGVAPGARLWAVKVLGADGSGYLSDIIAGVDWVTKHADIIEVANMSLGGQGVSQAYRTAIQNSVAAGVVYVVASGNDYRDILGNDLTFGTSDDTIPAAYPEVAAISAIADTDGMPGGMGPSTDFADYFGSYGDDTYADFSNYSNSDGNNESWYDTNNYVDSPGLGIDLMMPGVDIYSTYKNGGYATGSGTSMAAPHAAGLAALYIATNDRAHDAAGVYAIRQALIDTGQPWRSEEGLGLITGSNPDSPDKYEENLGWAGTSEPIDQPPTVSVTAPSDGAVVTGTVTVTVDASDDQGITQVAFFVDSESIGVDMDGSDGWSVDWQTGNDGSYTVTAEATDTGDQTASDSVVVTVNNTIPSTMHVGDLDGTSNAVNRKKWSATVTVTVRDASDSPTPNATVEGTWSNGIVSTASTDDGGLATLYSGNVDNTVVSVTFTVTNIVHASLTYDPNANEDTEGDSNGTAIVIFQDGRTALPLASTAAGGLSSAASVQNLGRDVADVAARQALALSSHPTGTGRLDDEHAPEDIGVLANVELVANPSAPSTVEQPRHALRAAEASLLDEAVDEAPLIDGELLDLLVQAL